MNLTFFVAYLIVAIATTVVLFVVSERLGDEHRPTLQRLVLSTAPGVVWPVTLLGVVQLVSLAACAKASERDDESERMAVSTRGSEQKAPTGEPVRACG